MRAATPPAVTELGLAMPLPRIDAQLAHAFNRLYRVHAPLSLALGARACQLSWQLSPPLHNHAIPTAETYGFQLGNQSGLLGFDALAHALVFNERRSALLPRELRYILLADALTPWVKQIEQATRLRFEWTLPQATDPEGSAGAHPDALSAACFEIEVAGEPHSRCGGWVQFDHPAALDTFTAALAPPSQPGPAIDWLALPLSFELGRTPMRLHEISGIRRGDIISIEQWQSSGSAIAAKLVLGQGHVSSLTALVDDARVTLQPWKDFIVSKLSTTVSTTGESPDAAGIALDRLDSMEVTLRFEVGDLSLSLRELRGIRPGHVFELAEPLNRSTVRIFAHGNTLGSGHLVAVGDRLGVRVTEFAPDVHKQ